MQSSVYFGCLYRCLLAILFYCSLLFYRSLLRYCRLNVVLAQLTTCHFTPVICLFNFETWPRRFAWFTIKQWKFAISHSKWRIRLNKSSLVLCMIPLSIHIAYHYQHLCFPLLFYGHKLLRDRLRRHTAIGQLPRTHVLLPTYFVVVCVFVFSQFIYSNLLFFVALACGAKTRAIIKRNRLAKASKWDIPRYLHK